MAKKYIIEGPALDKVLRENRIRISKGDIIVTPFEEAAPIPEQESAPVPPVPPAPEAPVEETAEAP